MTFVLALIRSCQCAELTRSSQGLDNQSFVLCSLTSDIMVLFLIGLVK